MPEERPVTNLTILGRPVDEKVEEPPSGEMPVDDEAYEPMPENRPVTDPRLAIRPVNVMTYESTPRDERFDNQAIIRRPANGDKSIPTTDGRPTAGPNMIIRPKEGEVDPEAIPLLHKAPPPSEVPEWSDGEVMPLIIIENNSSGVNLKTTDGRVPVGSDILLPKSLERNNSEDQGVLSVPMSPNRVRKGHSQDMPGEGSIFDVSPDVPGFHMRPAGGGVQPADITQPRLRTTSASTIRSSEHQLRLLSAKIPRGWIQRRRCPSIIYQKTVVLVLTSRQYRPCTPGSFTGHYPLVDRGGYHTGYREGRTA